MRKSTDNLLIQLQQSNCNIESYLKNNPESFVYHSINEFWESAIRRSKMSKSNIINKADFSYCYFYDVINGRKIPSKDKIVRLIITMGLGVDDCQEALRVSGRSSLYPRVRRDSIIIFAINNSLDIYETSELLLKCGEETLK